MAHISATDCYEFELFYTAIRNIFSKHRFLANYPKRKYKNLPNIGIPPDAFFAYVTVKHSGIPDIIAWKADLFIKIIII